MGKPTIRFEGYTDDWEQRKLDDVVEFLDTMRKPLEGAKRISGPYPYYGASGIVDYVDGYLFDEELILLSEDGANITDRNYPVCFLASGKYWVNNHAHVLRTKQGNENNFICNSLERKDYTQYNTGMAMPKLNKETCKKIPILCPGFEEQKKIGDYFRSLDNLITLHQRKCEETKKLKKFMLQKMFPKKGEKVPEIRFGGFTDDWEQRKLDDVVEFLDTMRKPLEGAKRISGPYPYYGASGIVDYVDGYLFDEELILLSEDGANITDRNYPVCFLASGKYWVNNHAHVLRTKQGNENNFICNSLERKDYTQYNTGMAMPKLNKETCKKIPILCPGFEEQKKIGDYFRSLDNLITLHQHKCEELQNIKKFMLQNMFI
ncbi:restriction endonuclease subunit S [Dorea amylophila]|uniref:restriction endonuclease subunit S n=1 Tax=Dorea amylophila TaxID=2981789 RepID=UPI0032644FF3